MRSSVNVGPERRRFLGSTCNEWGSANCLDLSAPHSRRQDVRGPEWQTIVCPSSPGVTKYPSTGSRCHCQCRRFHWPRQTGTHVPGSSMLGSLDCLTPPPLLLRCTRCWRGFPERTSSPWPFPCGDALIHPGVVSALRVTQRKLRIAQIAREGPGWKLVRCIPRNHPGVSLRGFIDLSYSVASERRQGSVNRAAGGRSKIDARHQTWHRRTHLEETYNLTA